MRAAVDRLAGVPLWVALLVLVVMLGLCLVAALTPARWALPVAVLAALLYLRTNTRLEGSILLTVSPGNGLTLGDLPAPLSLAAAVLLRRRRVRHDG